MTQIPVCSMSTCCLKKKDAQSVFTWEAGLSYTFQPLACFSRIVEVSVGKAFGLYLSDLGEVFSEGACSYGNFSLDN